MSFGTLFKAKCKGILPFMQKEVEGYYVKIDGMHFILPLFEKNRAMGYNSKKDFYEIIPETLCVYTGKLDSNVERIYENDRCRVRNDNAGEEEVFTVKWDYQKAKFVLIGNKPTIDFEDVTGWHIEVIGETKW